jgi:hydrogenase expression/formation protein HypE
MSESFQPSCPIGSDNPKDCVSLAHGEGGRLMRSLIRDRIATVLGSTSQDLGDAADLGETPGSLAITTDSFVVSPLFFPGGDIGSLAVFGTVNDLAVAGAKPLWLTLSLIIEEGLPLATFDRVIACIAAAAKQCDVRIVAGDTKVVPAGAADQVFINTTGVGQLAEPKLAGAARIEDKDVLLVSGPIGKHGIAVMTERHNLGFSPPPESDSAPIHEVAAALHQTLGNDLVAMRDATRGGVAAVMHEWAEASGTTMSLEESAIPVTGDVRGACELLGLDPMYVANEGTFLAAVKPHASERALQVLRSFPRFRSAVAIGHATAAMNAAVVIQRLLGSLQPVDEPAGAPLPRIC